MLLLLPVCYFIQEMVVRLGIATGKGHAAMIYQRFGKWWGRFSLFDLLLVNFLTLVTEFAAISLATQQMAAPGLPNRYDCSFHVPRDRPREPSAGEELIYDLDFGPVLFSQHAAGFPSRRDGAFMSNSTESNRLR
jgi:amino acid transporter